MSGDSHAWLHLPDLERRIKAANDLPPDLLLVRDLVASLSNALDKDVKVDKHSGTLSWGRGDKHGGVSIQANHYWITEWAGNDYMDIHPVNAEKVVWYLCGFGSPPDEYRAYLQIVQRRRANGKLRHTPPLASSFSTPFDVDGEQAEKAGFWIKAMIYPIGVVLMLAYIIFSQGSFTRGF